MFLVFLDESGSPYRDYARFRRGYEKRLEAAVHGPMPQYPFFILAAVGVHECHLPMVDEWFGGIRRRFLHNVDDVAKQEYEIKGNVLYALRQGLTPLAWQGGRRSKQSHVPVQRAIWSSLEAYQLRHVEKSVFDLLGRLAPVVWAVVVRQHDIFRKHGPRTWTPYYWALTYLQQRVLHHTQALHGAYERALFLMDETSTLSSAADFDEYLATRDTINKTAAWPVEFGRYLVDIPVFGKSHLHQALQLADVVFHAVWRHVRGADPLRWFDRIEPLLATHWRTRTYWNAGLTVIE